MPPSSRRPPATHGSTRPLEERSPLSSRRLPYRALWHDSLRGLEWRCERLCVGVYSLSLTPQDRGGILSPPVILPLLGAQLPVVVHLLPHLRLPLPSPSPSHRLVADPPLRPFTTPELPIHPRYCSPAWLRQDVLPSGKSSPRAFLPAP